MEARSGQKNFLQDMLGKYVMNPSTGLDTFTYLEGKEHEYNALLDWGDKLGLLDVSGQPEEEEKEGEAPGAEGAGEAAAAAAGEGEGGEAEGGGAGGRPGKASTLFFKGGRGKDRRKQAAAAAEIKRQQAALPSAGEEEEARRVAMLKELKGALPALAKLGDRCAMREEPWLECMHARLRLDLPPAPNMQICLQICMLHTLRTRSQEAAGTHAALGGGDGGRAGRRRAGCAGACLAQEPCGGGHGHPV